MNLVWIIWGKSLGEFKMTGLMRPGTEIEIHWPEIDVTKTLVVGDVSPAGVVKAESGGMLHPSIMVRRYRVLR